MDDCPKRDTPPSADPRRELIRGLRAQLQQSGALATPGDARLVFSSGVAAIDRLLPGGGLRHGMLVEWIAAEPGPGAATLGLLAAREASREGGVLVVIDRGAMFYPPAAAAWGVDVARLIAVRPQNARDEIWAAIQALRSPVVAAVWTRIERLTSRDFRRLQLAAEAGRTLGVLVRGASARGQPSWAEVRLGISREQGAESREKKTLRSLLPAHRRLVQVSLLHLRGGRSGGSVLVELDHAAHEVREVHPLAGQNAWPMAASRPPKTSSHDSHSLPVVAELADPTARSHSARA